RQTVKWGTAVDFHVGATDGSGLPVPVQVNNLPDGAVFDAETEHFNWTPGELQKGVHRITFAATNQAGLSSARAVKIDVDAGAPYLNRQALRCSPNAIGTVRGKWLSSTGTALSAPAGDAMELGKTQVKINGESVAVLYSSPTQVNFLCPVANTDSELSLVV